MFLNEVPLWIFLLPYKQNENPQSQEFLRGKMTLNGTKCALAAGSAPSPSEESVSLKRLAHSHSKIAWAVLFFNFFRAERNRTMGPKRLPSSLPQFWKSSSVKKTTIKTWGWKIEMLNAFQSKLWCGWSWSSNQRMFHNYGLLMSKLRVASSAFHLMLLWNFASLVLQSVYNYILRIVASIIISKKAETFGFQIISHPISNEKWKKQNIWHIGFCSIPILTQKNDERKGGARILHTQQALAQRQRNVSPHGNGECQGALASNAWSSKWVRKNNYETNSIYYVYKRISVYVCIVLFVLYCLYACMHVCIALHVCIAM